MKNKGGRPRKLTPEIKEAILEGVRKGLNLKAVCKSAGISYSALASWKRYVKIKDDNEADLYAELRISIDNEMECAGRQHRETVLANLKEEDFKFRKKKRAAPINRKERAEKRSIDAIANLRERFEKLKSELAG